MLGPMIEKVSGQKISGDKKTIPKQLVWLVLAICVLPFLLNLFGIDFGSAKKPFDFSAVAGMKSDEVVDSMFYSLSGSFTHTFLEWSAFCTAIFIVILSFTHYKIKKDVTIPVIGMALFCATRPGCRAPES